MIQINIENEHELMALHKALMTVKFQENSPCKELQGSPFIANVANNVFEAIIDLEKESGRQAAVDGWNKWRKADPKRDEYIFTQSKIEKAKASGLWENLADEERISYVKDLISPLTLSEEMMSLISQ